jgi:hypothetical protein
MSFINDVSAKSLYAANQQLLQSIFHHPPDLPNESSSYLNRILYIHQIIRDDINGICLNAAELPQPKKVASVETVSESLKDLEKLIFGENTKIFNPTIVGCIAHTKKILLALQAKQQYCTIL